MDPWMAFSMVIGYPFAAETAEKGQHGPDKCKQLDEVKPHGAG